MSSKPAIATAVPESAGARPRLARADLLSLGLLAVAAIFILSNLTQWPLWFDEGWTFEVAQTWLSEGHYGVLAADGPRGKSLAAALPTVASTALGFQLFGLGIWQGRLPAALLMLLALALLAALARRLASPPIAAATLAIALLTTHVAIGPLGLGVQALAEPAMVAALAAAFLALPAALARPWPWMAPFWLLAALGIVAKGQPLPFVTLALLLPAALALAAGQRRTAARLVIALAGALLLAFALPALQAALLAGRSAPGDPTPDLTRVIALNLDPGLRLMALSGLYGSATTMLGLAYGLGGLGYALWRGRGRLPAAMAEPRAITRVALLTLAGSWAAWYLLLSIGWPRYLFLPAFFGAFFAAEMLGRLSGGFDLRATLAHLAPGRATRRGLLGAAAMVAIYLASTLLLLSGLVERFGDPAPAQAPALTTGWLNANTPPGALIETYDAELLFQLDRPFHYPPDRYHAEILSMQQRRPGASTRYDPLSLAPDYIAVGPFADEADLYRQAIDKGGYGLVFEQGPYRVYARQP
jgi:hypothetical protein